MSFCSLLKKSGFFVLNCLLILSLLIFPAHNVSAAAITPSTDMSFDCASAILMDADTGTVLFEQNADASLPPASVTKIMTLLLVMEEIEKGNLKYTDMITASANAASMGGSQIYLKEGEEMTAEDMIKSVVVSSANDAAVALAEHIAGSESVFVARMNERAKELGMTNTNFENTNGLDDTATNHVTSARDIAIMSRELIKHEDILKYSSIWMDTIRNGAFGLTNTNRLVRFYEGATGLKTGSTSKAKFCVSATAKRDGMHLICVIMAAPSSDVRNSIATQLLNWGFANYCIYKNEGREITPMTVLGGVADKCKIKYESFSSVLKKGDNAKVELKYVLPENVAAPIKAGDEIGYIEYTCNGESIGKSRIIASQDVNKISFWEIFERMLSKFVLK